MSSDIMLKHINFKKKVESSQLRYFGTLKSWNAFSILNGLDNGNLNSKNRTISTCKIDTMTTIIVELHLNDGSRGNGSNYIFYRS